MSSQKKAKIKSILFVIPYPLDHAPGQRFRFELFLDNFQENSHSHMVAPLLEIKSYRLLYVPNQKLKKTVGLLKGLLKRLILLLSIPKYEFIFIFREAFFFGPPIFEWIIAKVLRKKIIYDFDDAIWLADPTGESRLWKWLKWRSKVALICKWSWKVSVGNEYLAEYARQFNKNVIVLPTVVDTEVHTAKCQKLKAESQRPVIGWTGSHSTLQYLELLLPALRELEEQIDFEFMVIADQNPELPLKNFRFVKWKKDSEVDDLAQIDIGVMPLPDDEWSKGKCGFKLIQYLALGIPAVAPPVGVNPQIIKQGVTGFLAESKQQWVEHIKKLIQNPSLRAEMGRKGQKLILDSYSVKSQKKKFLSLFEDSYSSPKY